MTAPDQALKAAVEQLSALAKTLSDTEITSYKMPGNTANIWASRIRALLAALSSQASVMEEMAKALEEISRANRSASAGYVIDIARTALSQYRTLGGE